MSELRFNELRDEQVAYAIHRQERTFLPSAGRCPLCPTRPGGPETEIPFDRFEIAVFDNRFPAFEQPLGAAEVVVYTDSHEGSLGTLPAERAEALMWVWRHRYLELGAREDVHYVLIFENRGVEVGVTLHHPHGQIYGYPFLPPVPQLELSADQRLRGCAPCALLREELAGGRRVIYENEHVVAYVPYAARWAYEVHVVLREHRPNLLACEAGGSPESSTTSRQPSRRSGTGSIASVLKSMHRAACASPQSDASWSNRPVCAPTHMFSTRAHRRAVAIRSRAPPA